MMHELEVFKFIYQRVPALKKKVFNILNYK